MRLRRGLLVTALAAAVVWPPAVLAQDSVEALRTAHRSGRYQEVLDSVESAALRGSAESPELRILIDTLLETGAYHDALEIAAASERRMGAELAYGHGRALLAVGRRAEAEDAFVRAQEAGGADALQARLWRAILEFESGRREAAMERFDGFIDVYNRGSDLSSADLTAIGVACSYLGLRDPQLFHDAVRAFDEAIAVDAGDLEPRLRLGELFLDKYDSSEAAGLIAEVLAANPSHPRGWLAEARRRQFDGEGSVQEAIGAALEHNPSLPEAHVFRARMRLMVEDADGAAELAREALEIAPGHRAALAMLAASHYVGDEPAEYERVVERALEADPRFAELFVTVADMAVYNRLYPEAVELATRALELDPDLAAAWGVRGINELRVGRIESGRESLERAFAGDPFNVWFKNTLDLLDTFSGYETVATENFDLFLEAGRADLLALYMEPLAEEALASLSERYGYRPDGRVRVEVFSRHADFSVRTVGLAGIGALGVAFGPVVAVDGPAAPGMGEFNWAATLWHEIAHVITLGASGNRVPRWLTEGLSVFEERRARPGWGDDISPGFLMAWLADRLHPVSRINDGFVRPSYPGHVGHSYLQASLVCELIAERYGFEALPAMLDGYRRGLETPEVFRQALGVAPDGLDAVFTDWFESRYGRQLAALRPAAELIPEEGHDAGPPETSFAEIVERAADPNDYVAKVTLGRALIERGSFEEAVAELEQARELFPEHAGVDGAYPLLAHAYEEIGRPAAAIATLEAMTARNAGHAAAWEQLARLHEEGGRFGDAARSLAQVVWIDPGSIELQRRIASLAERAGDWDRAVRARAAVVALAPVDRAEALYRLALAHAEAGDGRQARRAVLRALEIAPSYAEAQQLLLRLRSGSEETR